MTSPPAARIARSPAPNGVVDPKHPVRTGAASAVALALLLAVAGCGGGGGGTEAPPDPASRSVKLQASAPGDLARHVQALLRERERAARDGGSAPVSIGPAPAGPPADPRAVVGDASNTPRSDTLLQEAGVDEADLLKSDGRHLFGLTAPPSGPLQFLSYRRASDGSVVAQARLELPEGSIWGSGGQGILLAGDAAEARAAVVIAQRWQPMPCDGDVCPASSAAPALTVAPMWVTGSVSVQRLALAAGQPSLGTELQIDGTLVDSRRIGDRLVLVTRHFPRLPVDRLAASASPAEREAAIARTSAADLLPRVRVGAGAPTPLMADSDCFVQAGNASLAVEVTSISVIDLASPTLAQTSRCFVGGSEALYMTTEALYIATTRWQVQSSARGPLYPGNIRTDIHKFALPASSDEGNGRGVTYRASGDVPGHLGWHADRKSLRLSEHAGVLRVLTFTGSRGWMIAADASAADAPPPSPATLSMLREQGGALQVVAQLPNAKRPAALGKPGEQIYGVRFLGDRGYVVTFRVVDPLYVLDLADPADPKVAGELELPGFSDHLVPLPGGLLFGVGREVDASGFMQGVKVTLLDVSDASRPREIAQQVFGGRGSSSALDFSRHGLNLMRVGDVVRLALPLAEAGADWQLQRHGLQRFEVDVVARTLAVKPMVDATTTSHLSGPWPDLWQQRSLQIGDHAYYLRRGEVSANAW